MISGFEAYGQESQGLTVLFNRLETMKLHLASFLEKGTLI